MSDYAPNERPKRLRDTSRTLPIALLQAREVVMGPIRELLARSPVNEQKWRVLRVLDEAGPMDQSEIAKRACLQLPSLTRILAAMEAQGQVTRATHPEDRRRTVVAITPIGAQIIEENTHAFLQVFDRIADRFGHLKMEQLLDLLEELRTLDHSNPDQE